MKTNALLILLAVIVLAPVRAQDSKLIVDLRGTWKFEIGDKTEWSDPSFNDAKWDNIFVPAEWENEGYPGYDGYAWYRKTFTLPKAAAEQPLYLHLVVDDVCDVYINGHQIGEGGQFPPKYATAYNVQHQFFIPASFLRPNQENSIAVRVYDKQLQGGIVSGRIGIYEHHPGLRFAVRFPDWWKFKIGDNLEWADPDLDDSAWKELIVPAQWDFQGYRSYDGFAWYRVRFTLPDQLPVNDLVLLLGKIDDIDEAYINGELVGKTGRIRTDRRMGRLDNEYKDYRVYRIPASALHAGAGNVLAVRVYDWFSYGGIYEGPIGIIRAQDFKKWEPAFRNDNQNNNSKSFQWWFEKIFEE